MIQMTKMIILFIDNKKCQKPKNRRYTNTKIKKGHTPLTLHTPIQ